MEEGTDKQDHGNYGDDVKTEVEAAVEGRRPVPCTPPVLCNLQGRPRMSPPVGDRRGGLRDTAP